MFKKQYLFYLTLIATLGLSLILAIGQITAQDNSTCPVGQGYWKNTPTWPITQIMLGSQTYTQVEVLILLNTPPAGDASLILAHQLIAAKLNVAKGLDSAPKDSTRLSLRVLSRKVMPCWRASQADCPIMLQHLMPQDKPSST